MSKVARKGDRRKPEVRLSREAEAAVEDLDARVEMIQALIPLGLKAVEDELERAGAYRVYQDPADLRRHVDEVGVRVTR